MMVMFSAHTLINYSLRLHRYSHARHRSTQNTSEMLNLNAGMQGTSKADMLVGNFQDKIEVHVSSEHRYPHLSVKLDGLDLFITFNVTFLKL